MPILPSSSVPRHRKQAAFSDQSLRPWHSPASVHCSPACSLPRLIDHHEDHALGSRVLRSRSSSSIGVPLPPIPPGWRMRGDPTPGTRRVVSSVVKVQNPPQPGGGFLPPSSGGSVVYPPPAISDKWWVHRIRCDGAGCSLPPRAASALSPAEQGGDAGSRTPYLLRAKQALFQLSYIPGWGILDSNQGPQSYQDCALTT